MAQLTTCSKEVSHNRKTGPVYTTHRAVGPTCPTTCSFFNKGCYAQSGPVHIHALRAKKIADNVATWLGGLPPKALVRHLVSGDLMIDGHLDDGEDGYITEMLFGHRQRIDVRGWSYTHTWRINNSPQLNSLKNLTVNASCDSLADVPAALEAGWPAVVVVPPDWDKNVTDCGSYTVVTCPQQRKAQITCSSCQLCLKKDRTSRGKPMVIAFKGHASPALMPTLRRTIAPLWVRSAQHLYADQEGLGGESI